MDYEADRDAVPIAPAEEARGVEASDPDQAAPPTTGSPGVEPAATEAPPYPPPAAMPTQVGPDGIRFDFNLGARVLLPARTTGKWRIRLRDLDTGNILFETENQGAFVTSSKVYFVRFSLEVWDVDEGGVATPMMHHEYDARDRTVLIQFPVGTLGDVLAWFSYAARFRAVHHCDLTVALSDLISPLLQGAYPDIIFVTHQELIEQKLADTAYATYCVGLFFDDTDAIWQPVDFRHVGLHRTAAYILGVDPAEEPPRLAFPDDTRPIAEKYVCIGVQSSSGCKLWNNPYGWRAVVSFLKEAGYRVICIDQKAVHGTGLLWNHIPHGVEDETGDRPLTERARLLRHAAFFVGLSSGLSWLAWAAGTPVVMISGFTQPTNEFATPFRIINRHTCNGCWNDPRHRFDHRDFLWCPRHAGTERQFECTRLITTEHVIRVIRSLLASIDEPAAPNSPVHAIVAGETQS